MADALKAEGNKAFAAKDFQTAVEKFTEAIALDPTNHVLYSNRSGAYASLRDFQKALEDAEKVTEIKADWPKGWGRKGAALHGLGDLLGANDAYEEALKLDPSNAQAKSGLDAVKRAMESESEGAGDFMNMFKDPNLIQKLAANPKTAPLLADTQFVNKLQSLRTNPNGMQEAFQDPRFLQVMGVLMGIDMQFGGPGDAAKAAAENSTAEDVKMEDAPAAEPKKEEKKAEPAPEPTPEVVEDDEAAAKRKAKEEGDKEKALGTASYKKREFDDAIAHYAKAWELYKDITYLTNMGAAKFEKGDYDGCIEACQTAVTEGREMLADFKIIAKAFGRIGTAYERKGDLANAITYYQKALTEHRTPDILTKLRNAEKNKIQAEKEAYINPEEAQKARELGNEKFKAGDYPAA
ncbi:ubiquitin-protein transferase activating protein, partial [Ascosphaera pollenicola]